MVDGDFKDLTRSKACDKIKCDIAFNIAKNPKYDGYRHRVASMVYTFFDKKKFWWCHYACTVRDLSYVK